jgi:predicted small secreted protein
MMHMTIDNRRTFLAATIAALCGALVSGCNAVEGVGQDIENAGDAIGDKARKEKRK